MDTKGNRSAGFVCCLQYEFATRQQGKRVDNYITYLVVEEESGGWGSWCVVVHWRKDDNPLFLAWRYLVIAQQIAITSLRIRSITTAENETTTAMVAVDH